MTPEEIEELRALVARLSGTAYNENLAAILGAALEHIHKQEEQLDNTRAVLAQVAALQEIAIEERAGPKISKFCHCEKCWPLGESKPPYLIKAEENERQTARRQLSEEHPEVDWK